MCLRRRSFMLRAVRSACVPFLLMAVASAAVATSARADDEKPATSLDQLLRDQENRDFERRYAAACADFDEQDLAVIVAISHAGGPIHVREFGALKDDGIPAEETQVDVNSITKSFTGVVVSKAVEDGKLRLDETLGEIFEDVPDDKAGITVHQLLTHAAGFPEAVGSDEEELARSEFLDRAFRAPLVHPPGEKYRYSNVGFSILAAIVGMRSGKDYETYLQEDVLAGLGFENIGYGSVYDESRSLRTTRGRSIKEASWGGHDASWHLIGNGGWLCTAPEFIRFRQAVTSGKILSPAALERLHTPHIKEDALGVSHYGYGLVVQESRRYGLDYWHDGGNGVYSAQWSDFHDRGDVIFTAGPDQNAMKAMGVLSRHLYREP